MSAATVALRLASAGERLDFDAPRRRSPARAAAAVRPRSSRQSITRGRRRRDVTTTMASAFAVTGYPPGGAVRSAGFTRRAGGARPVPLHEWAQHQRASCVVRAGTTNMSSVSTSSDGAGNPTTAAAAAAAGGLGTASGFTQRGDGGYDYSSDLAELTDPEAGPQAARWMGFALEEFGCHMPLCPPRPHLSPSRPRLGPCTGCQWFQRQNRSC